MVENFLCLPVVCSREVIFFLIAKTIYVSGLFSIRWIDGGVTLYFFWLGLELLLKLIIVVCFEVQLVKCYVYSKLFDHLH